MNEAERRKLEQLLRDALHEEAARIHPAGDGLARIRQRVADRRRVQSWLRPSVGVLTAVVVVAAAATAVPVYLHTGGSPRQHSAEGALGASPRPGADSTAPAATLSGEVDVSTRSQPPTPSASAATLPDMPTVWPYGSRSEGTQRADRDVRQRVRPDLRDPGATAVQFVKSFVGSGDELVSDRGMPLEAGIGITVSRRTPDGSLAPVSEVYLVRVRQADDSPYVVVDARGPDAKGKPAMRVDPGPLAGTEALKVEGSFVEVGATTASVKVQLREPGGDEVLASDSPLFTTDPAVPLRQTWQSSLTPVRALRTATGTVAAWTVDVENHVLAFVAEPTDPD